MKTILSLPILSLLVWSCGSSSTSSIQTFEVSNQPVYEVIDTTYIPKNFASEEGLRAVDPAEPPTQIDLQASTPSPKPFDLADYYTRSRIVKLEFPVDTGAFADSDIIYLCGYMMVKPITQVARMGNHLIAHDYINGCFVFDLEGKFIDTLYTNKATFKYDKREKAFIATHENYNRNSGLIMLRSSDANALVFARYKETDFKKPTYYWWNTKDRKVYKEMTESRNRKGVFPQLNDSISLEFRAPAALDDKKVQLYFFNPQGDTVGLFHDYVLLKEAKMINYTRYADMPIAYRLGESTYVRQPYNDTVFRIASPNRLIPAYVMKFGNKKPTIDIGFYGDKTNYLFIDGWTETSKYALISASQNYDCPNTRKNGTVKFFYTLFDKQTKQQYRLPQSTPPDEAYIANSLPNGLPILIDRLIPDEKGHVTVKYNKRDIDQLIASSAFKTFSPEQQALAKRLSKELSPRTIVVQVIE